MEGGVDAEERSSLDAAHESAQQDLRLQDGSGEENKFQKAIGAWRSTLYLGKEPCRSRLTMR
jgi:homeobox protein cut-like